jgi:hypothetical protein
MKTQVAFRSAKFPAYADEDERINPGVWGQRLAEYLDSGLSARGIETDSIVAEDWGATPQLTELSGVLEDILASDPDITDVVWTDS